MEIKAENAEKLDVGNHSGALLAKGLLIDCINAGDALEEKVSELEKRNAELLQQLHETKNKLASALEQIPVWHDAEKELPEDRKPVLVKVIGNPSLDPITAWYIARDSGKHEWCSIEIDLNYYGPVSMWAYKPIPPKELKNETK